MLCKKKILRRLGIAAAFTCLALGAAANGTLYGDKYCYDAATKKTVPLVMGGIGSKLTLTPSSDQAVHSMGSSDLTWLNYNILGTIASTPGIEVYITAEPDTAARTGYVWYKSQSLQLYDTIYVTQPGIPCIDPKQESSGSEFYVAFMENAETNVPIHLRLYATSDFRTKVRVYNNATNVLVGAETVIEPNQTKEIYYQSGNDLASVRALPAYNYEYEKVTTKSFRVEADAPISLYAYNAASTTSEISYTIPTRALGDEYFILSYSGINEMPEEFMVIATEDTTLVTITPADETYGEGTYNSQYTGKGANPKSANNPFTITLHKGQTYLVRSKTRGASGGVGFVAPGLTGTHVKASKPVAVFGGHKRTGIGATTCANSSRDHLFEQMLPLRSWGKRYALVQTNQPGNPYRIVAAYENTDVTITDSRGLVETLTLQRGEYVERNIVTSTSPYAYIEASKPVAVAMFALTTSCAQVQAGDPFLLAIGPADRGISHATFSPVPLISTNTYSGHYVTVVVEQLYKDQTKLTRSSTGVPPALIPLAFYDMPNTPYAYAIQKIDYDQDFNYQLSNPYGFTAYGYGYGYMESYGFLIGVHLGEKIEESSDIGLPIDIAYCRGAPYAALPQCIDGTTGCVDSTGDDAAVKQEKDKKKLFWYKNLDDWRDGNYLPAPPPFNTNRDTTYNFFVSRMGRCGIFYPQQITRRVLKRPAVAFADDTVCLSTPIPAGGYDYGGWPRGGTYILAGTQNAFSHASAGAGTHEVTYTYTDPATGCDSAVTAWVTVETLDRGPFIRVASGDTLLCPGDKVKLQVANASNRTFQWYHKGAGKNDPDTAISGVTTEPTYTVAPEGKVYAAGTYAAVVSNQNGCIVRVSVEVKISDNPRKPEISIDGAASSFCVGGGYTLYDENYVALSESAMTYHWYLTDLTHTVLEGADEYEYRVDNAQIAEQYRYILGVKNFAQGTPAKGCWSYDTLGITVFAAANDPQIYGNSTQYLCDGDSLTLIAQAYSSERYTYKWYTKNALGHSILLPSSGSTISVKEGKYHARSVSEHGCPSKGSSPEVAVEKRVSVSVPILALGAKVCEGGAINITASTNSSPAGSVTSYRWYVVGASNAYTEIENAVNAVYGVTASGRYAARAITTYTDGVLSCYSPYSAPQLVELWPRPLAPEVTGATDVCVGENNVSLTAAPASGSYPVAKYRWYKNGAQMTEQISSNLRLTQDIGAVSYTVVGIATHDATTECVSLLSDSVRVTVWKPAVSVAGADTRDTCYGNAITLTATTDMGGGGSYQWYKNDTDSLPDGKTQSYMVRGSNPLVTETARYRLRVTNKYGCSSELSKSIEVTTYMASNAPTVTVNPADNACEGDPVTLTATRPSNGTYEWFFEKDGTLEHVHYGGTDSIYTIAAKTEHNGRFAVRITTTDGCVSQAGWGSVTVSALPEPPEIIPDYQNICSGDSTRIQAISSTGHAYYQYRWFIDEGTGPRELTSLSDGTIYATLAGSYWVYGRNEKGCWSSARSEVKAIAVHRKPETPAITPDKDTVAVCVRSATYLTGFSHGATLFQWYAVKPSGSLDPLGEVAGSNFKVEQSGSYVVRAYLTYADATLQCPSDNVSRPKAVRLYDVPFKPRIISPQSSVSSATACAGETVKLVAQLEFGDPANVTSYVWYKVKDGNEVKLNFVSTDTCPVTQIEDAKYQLVAVSDEGCESDRSDLYDVRIRKPIVSIADDVEKIICHGGEVTLSAITNAGPNSSYQWYKGNDAIPNSDAPSYTMLSEGDPTVEKRASYSLIVTDAQGCETSRSNAVEVSVNPLPIPPVVTTSGVVCEGGLVTLTASPSGQGSYEWFFERNGVFESVSAASSVASYRIPSIRLADAGLYRVKVTNKYGCYMEGDARAMVNSLPQAPDITPKGSIRLCTGDSMLLTAYTAGASAGYRHEWWFDNGNSNVNLNVSGDHLYAKQTGVYSARSISDSGCVSADRGLVSVEIYYRPVTPIITPNAPVVSICANGATTITAAAAGATSYQWYTVDQADSYSIIPGSTGSSYAAGESGRYAIRADIRHDDLTCSSFSVPKVMNLFPVPPPPVMAADKTSACAGDVITITASPGPGSPQPKSYRWYVNGTPQTFVVTDTIFATKVEAATYKVAIISADNCESDASIPKEIIIRARPTVSIDDGVRETCGGTVRLSASMNPPNTAGSYQWYENDTVYIPEASTSPILVQNSANPLAGKKATYYLYATDKFGCRSADPSNRVEVNIRALPPNPVATVDLANGVCEGSSTTLRVSPSGAGTYKWFHSRDGRSFDSIAITSDTVLRVLSAQTSDAGLYAVEVTNAWGCTSALRGEAELNVLGLPKVYFTATRACENDTEFNAVEPDGGLFSGWGCTPDGRFIPADVHQGEAVVTYAYTAPNGCANHDTKNIEIIRLPNTPTVTAAGPTEVCPGDISVALQTSVAVIASDEYNTSYSYQWYKDGFPIPGEVALTYVATKEGSYAVRVCNQNLCWAISPSAPVAVSYLPTPVPPVIASQSAFFCPGSLVELFVQSEGRGIFQWYKGDGKKMEEVLGEIADTYLVGEAGQYAVDYIGETGCRSALSNSLTITQYPAPKQPEIVSSQANLYAGLDYKLLVKFPEEGEQYGWYKNTLYANVEAPAFPITNLSGKDTGSYMVKAVNPQGCDLWSEPYVLKLTKAELFVPNIFTPNGDGVNDYFQIIGLDDFTENKLEILNKYGKIVFSQKNYYNTWSGEGLPTDVYYYKLELKRLDGNTSVLNGFVHLKR